MSNTRLILVLTDVGGPPALHDLLSQLPEEFSLPRLVIPSQDIGLHESSTAALKRTISLAVRPLKSAEALRGGSVYFADTGSLYRARVMGQDVHVGKIKDSVGSEHLSEIVESFTQILAEDLLLVVLSGKGEKQQITECCRSLSAAGCRVIVLDRRDSLAFQMGEGFLQDCTQAEEMRMSEIIAFLQTCAMRKQKTTSVNR